MDKNSLEELSDEILRRKVSENAFANPFKKIPSLLDKAESVGFSVDDSRLIRQLVGNISDMTVSSPKAEKDFPTVGEYIPNIVWGVGAIPGLVGDAYNWATDAETPKDKLGNDIPTALDKPREYFSSGVDKSNAEYTGIDDIKNWPEAIARFSPILPVSGPLKAANALVQNASKPVRMGTSLGTSLLLPQLQSTTKLGKAAEFGVGATIADFATEYGNPKGYNSLLFDQELTPEQEFAMLDIEDNSINLVSNPIDTMAKDLAFKKNPIGVTMSLDEFAAVKQQKSEGSIEGLTPEDTLRITGNVEEESWLSWSPSTKAAVATGAAVFGGVGVSAVIRAKQARSAARIRNNAATLGGSPNSPLKSEAPKTNPATGGRNLSADPEGIIPTSQVWKAQLYDSLSPITHLINKAEKAGTISIEKAATLVDDLELRLDPRSVIAKTRDFGRSADFPRNPHTGNVIRTEVPLQNLQERLTTLSPEQQGKLWNLQVIETKIDDLTNQVTKKNPSPKWGRYTRSDLQRMSNNLRADGQVAKLATQYQKIFADGAKYLRDNRAISVGDYLKMKNKSNHYAPLRLADTPTYSTDFSLSRRTDQLAVQPGEAANPAMLAPEYFERIIGHVEQNNARRRIIDFIAETGYMANSGKPAVHAFRGTEKQARKNDKVVSYILDGKKKYFQVEDDHLRAVLKTNPQWSEHYTWSVGNLIDAGARLARSTLTGPLSPGFLTRAGIYDSSTGFLTKNRKLNSGLLSKWGKDTPIDAITGRIDPSTLLNPLTGLVQDVWAETVNLTARKMDANLFGNKLLTRTFGEDFIGEMSAHLQQYYRNSTMRLKESGGGGSSPLWKVSDSELSSLGEAITPKLARQMSEKTSMKVNSVARLYDGMFGVAHGAPRTAVYGHNLKRSAEYMQITYRKNDGTRVTVPHWQRSVTNIPDVSQADRLSRKVHTHGGNPHRQGGIPGTTMGKWVRRYHNATLYSKVGVAVGGALGYAMIEDPIRTFGAMTTYSFGMLGYVHNEIMADPAKREKFLARSASQNAISTPIYNEEGDVVIEIGVVPEMRPMYSALLEGFLMMQGYRTPIDSIPADMGKRAWDEFWKSIIWEGLSPVAKGGAALTVLGTTEGESPARQYVGIPSYFTEKVSEAEPLTENVAAVRAVASAFANEIGDSIVTGTLAMMRTWDEGMDKVDSVGNFFSHATSKYRKEGNPVALLFPSEGRVAKSNSPSTPTNHYVYTTMSKIKSWNSRYKETIVHPGQRTQSLNPGEVPDEGDRYAPLTNPLEASIINLGVESLQNELNSQDLTRLLGDVELKKHKARYGGQQYPTKEEQNSVLSGLVDRQAQLVDRARMAIDRAEVAINFQLKEKGLEPNFSFLELDPYPEHEGKSRLVDTERYKYLEDNRKPFMPK